MPRVPQYDRQQGPPRSLGLRPQRQKNEGARARQQALTQIGEYSRERFEQDLKSEIVDAETDFQERARETMQEMKQLQGENAVANEATGRPGVYEKSKRSLDELKEEYQDRIPRDFQPALNRRLEQVKQSWLDNALQWEESERQKLQEYRASKAGEAAANHVQETGGDPDELKRATRRASQQIKAIYGDNYYSRAKIKETKHNAVKTAILSALNSGNIEQARQHLQDHSDLFGEEDVQTFETMINDTELKQQVEHWSDRLSGLPYEQQLAQIEQIEDQRLKEHVFNQVRGEKTIEDAREKERQSKQYQRTWEQIVMAKHQPDEHEMPSVQEIMDDPLLSVPQRNRLINMIGGEEESENDRRAQNRVWYELHSRINSGRNPPSRTEIMEASSKGLISPGMERSLLRELEDGTQFPSLGKAKDHLRYQLREQSGVIESDVEWKNFQHDLEKWARQRQQESGKQPSYDEIMQMGEKLAEEPKDKSWWPFYTGTGPAVFRREELPHYRQVVRPEPVPDDAAWDTNAQAYVFERNGDTYAMVPTGNGVRTFRRSPSEANKEQ